MIGNYCDPTIINDLRRRINSPRGDFDVKQVYKMICPIIIFICLLSIVCNAFLVGISRQSKQISKSPLLLLSLNLAITDMLTALLNGSNILINSYLPEVFDISFSWCNMLVVEILRTSALVASALHLLALAVVHYRGIVNPLHYK